MIRGVSYTVYLTQWELFLKRFIRLLGDIALIWFCFIYIDMIGKWVKKRMSNEN